MTRLIELTRRLVREEQGQSLVFGALSLFAVACFATMIANTGMVATQQVGIQNAADAAAYSGALVEANSIEAIAYIGDQMAVMYYQMMRYAVDLTVLDTLKGFRQCNGHPAYSMFDTDGDINYGAATGGASRLGGGGELSFDQIEEKYREAEKKYREWVGSPPGQGTDEGRGKLWLKRLARMQRQIAAATPGLIRKAVFAAAEAGGAQEVAIFPLPEGRWNDGWMVFNPQPGNKGAGVAVFETAEPWDFGYANATYRRGDNDLPFNNGNDGENWYDPGPVPGEDGLGASWAPWAYRQTRVCWHKKDLRHKRPDKHGGTEYDKFTKDGPNGHWHALHNHSLKDWEGEEYPAVHGPDDGGFLFGIGFLFGFEGNDDDGHRGALDPANHDNHFSFWDRFSASWKHESEEQPDHHADLTCDLCFAADISHDGYSQVNIYPFSGSSRRQHNAKDAQNTTPIADGDDLMGGDLPLPLKLRAEGLRQPINVAVWRSGSDPIVTAVFSGGWPSWGHFAFASAQVGPVDGPEVQVDSGRLDALAGHPYENLFTAQRWGARLVSLKHFKNAGTTPRGGALLDGFAHSASWWKVERDGYLNPRAGTQAKTKLLAVRRRGGAALDWKELDAAILH